jgi:ABC-2 type transport system ATP-binding protein
MNRPAIRLENITKRYGEFVAVDHLSLNIHEGEIFGFVGPNGAGKTTTIRMLTGLAFPSEGILEIKGLGYQQDALKIKQILGYIPDRPYVYDKLTGREYLEFVISIFSSNGFGETLQEHLKLFELDKWGDELIESYSHGMKQRLAFAAALIHRPEILVIDEPMVGLDPKGVRLIKDLLRELASKNVTVFVSTHNLEMAEEICDNIGIIHESHLIACDTIAGLRTQSSLPESDLEDIFLRLTTEELK